MKRKMAVACLAAWAAAANANIKVDVQAFDGTGGAKSIGQVTISPGPQGGIIIKPNLRELPPGAYALQIHEPGSCGPGEKSPRRVVASDLPHLQVNEYGFASRPLSHSRIDIDSLRNRSLVIGPRESAAPVACGVIARGVG